MYVRGSLRGKISDMVDTLGDLQNLAVYLDELWLSEEDLKCVNNAIEYLYDILEADIEET